MNEVTINLTASAAFQLLKLQPDDVLIIKYDPNLLFQTPNGRMGACELINDILKTTGIKNKTIKVPETYDFRAATLEQLYELREHLNEAVYDMENKR